MGPRGMITFEERISETILYRDCERRKKGIEMLLKNEFEQFMLYVVPERVPLFNAGVRRHNIRSKKYLLRDEFYNTNLLVKAILKGVSTSNILRMIDYGVLGMLEGLTPKDVELYSSFITVKVPDAINVDGPKGIRGMRGESGPGDDGYGHSACGSTPGYRQFLNDPISFVQSLFIHSDSNMAKLVLEKLPSYKKFLKYVFEIFLVCDDVEEVRKMYEYDAEIAPSFSYDFSRKHLKNDYSFIANKVWCDDVYQFDEGLFNIWY
jgi:hypothetical protein